MLAAVVVGGAVFAVLAVRHRDSSSGTSVAPIRVSGLPADVPTSLANLMSLSPVPNEQAPGFTLTDQHGKTFSLSSFRGHPVVLEFMDPHCTDICPIVAQEFIDAEHDLGKAASRVVFAAVNVNQYALSVADVATFSQEHRLDTIPTWHFFTGPFSTLRRIWAHYGIEVQSRGPTEDTIHSSIVYFIGPNGKERFLASPTDDHTKSGTAYLPPSQLSSWGRGIALVARALSG